VGELTIERWALQELYDHDAEHAAQLRRWRVATGIGRSLRDSLVDRMAAERAGLLIACLGLDTDTLCSQPVMDDWDGQGYAGARGGVGRRAHRALALAWPGESQKLRVLIWTSATRFCSRAARLVVRSGLASGARFEAGYLEILSTATNEQLVRPSIYPA